MLKKGKAVGSDDSTQSPDDDDGATDMRIIQYHPINKKEAKGKHKNNMGDMKANKCKQGMIGDMGLLIHPFLVPQNCHIQISALVVGQVTWAIFKVQTTGYGSFFTPGQLGESSSQQATTPRGIQRGFQDIAISLFGFGYTQYGGHEYGPLVQSHKRMVTYRPYLITKALIPSVLT
ncbi:hypothetical protein Taro_009956 [Colocasia esculenta]|uniref:Uncharacterized protein n=1 Tax=Colocasia esculenta TaxID=4460 RepID=A0A843U1Z5_COLES|nr:hypothetical protein [Colocasia esculenta]